MQAADATVPEESPAERRARQLAWFRRLGELGMRAAEVAAERIEDAHAQGLDADTASPTLDLARATRAVTAAVNAENRVARGDDLEPANPRVGPTPFDSRRAPLREALYLAVNAEPTPAARTALRRAIDRELEAALLADPAAETPIDEVLADVSDTLGIQLDYSKLSDEVIGMPPRIYHQPPGWDPEIAGGLWTPNGPRPIPKPEALQHDNE